MMSRSIICLSTPRSSLLLTGGGRIAPFFHLVFRGRPHHRVGCSPDLARSKRPDIRETVARTVPGTLLPREGDLGVVWHPISKGIVPRHITLEALVGGLPPEPFGSGSYNITF